MCPLFVRQSTQDGDGDSFSDCLLKDWKSTLEFMGRATANAIFGRMCPVDRINSSLCRQRLAFVLPAPCREEQVSLSKLCYSPCLSYNARRSRCCRRCMYASNRSEVSLHQDMGIYSSDFRYLPWQVQLPLSCHTSCQIGVVEDRFLACYYCWSCQKCICNLDRRRVEAVNPAYRLHSSF